MCVVYVDMNMLCAHSDISLQIKNFDTVNQNMEVVLQDWVTKEHTSSHLLKISIIYICFIEVKLQKDEFK